MQKATAQDMKRANYQSVLRLIYKRRVTSNPEIAAGLGLSRPTVTQYVNTLERQGLVEKSGFAASTGGRKASAVRFVAASRIALGVELLHDHLEIVAINLYGELLHTAREALPFENQPEYYARVCAAVGAFAAAHKIAKKRILGLGIVLQGLITADGKRVYYGEILHCTGLTADAFTQHLPYPCRLFHDAESAARVELWESPSLQNAIFFNIRTNLSGALIVGGRFLNGNNLKSGVFEHMTLIPDGRACYCGKKGCVDAYCSYPVLLEPDESLEAFFEKLRGGDTARAQKWKHYLGYLAQAIDNLHMVMDYDILLGGTLGRYLLPEDIMELHRLVVERTAFPTTQTFIRVAGQTGTPPAKGAALEFVTAHLASVMGA